MSPCTMGVSEEEIATIFAKVFKFKFPLVSSLEKKVDYIYWLRLFC